MKVVFTDLRLNAHPERGGRFMWGDYVPLSTLAQCACDILGDAGLPGMAVAIDGDCYETGRNAERESARRYNLLMERLPALHEEPLEKVVLQVWGSTLKWSSRDGSVEIEGSRTSIAGYWHPRLDLRRRDDLVATATSTPWLPPWHTMRDYTESLIRAEALMRDRYDLLAGMDTNHPLVRVSVDPEDGNFFTSVYAELKKFFNPGHDTQEAWQQAKGAVARHVRNLPLVTQG